jgi:hypothetical protein
VDVIYVAEIDGPSFLVDGLNCPMWKDAKLTPAVQLWGELDFDRR